MATNFLQGMMGGANFVNQLQDRAEQRKYRQMEIDDMNTQRNALGLMHIYDSFGDDPEKQQKFNNDMFQSMNNMPAIKEALSIEYPDGEPELSGLQPTAKGIVPMVSYTNAEGERVTDAVRMNGQPVAVSRGDFFNAIGSMPDLVSQAELSRARILGSGGALPDKDKKYRQEEVNGYLLNIDEGTGNANVLGKVSDASGSGKPKRYEWYVDTDEGRINYIAEQDDNGKWAKTELRPDGTLLFDDYKNQGGRSGGSSVFERMFSGMLNQPGQNEIQQKQPGIGVLKPELLQSGIQEKPDNSKPPDKGKETKETKETKEAKEAKEAPPSNPHTSSSVTGNKFDRYQMYRDMQEFNKKASKEREERFKRMGKIIEIGNKSEQLAK